jgi:hypothetical protein
VNPAAVRSFSRRGDLVGQALHEAHVLIGAATTPILASVPDPRRETLAMEGGSADEGELIVRILKTTLTTRPAEQQKLRWKRVAESTYRTPTWRILTVRDSTLDAAWHIRCIPAQ